MYIFRHASRTLQELGRHFGAILVSGPRQVGKTTLIEETVIKAGKKKVSQVTLDDPLTLEMARDEGGRFFQDHKPPVFVDEIQYAPTLFPYIKMIVDREKKNGLFFMSGSQQFSLMKDVSESLAGRVGILDILGLSLREIRKDPFGEPFCPDKAYLNARKKNLTALDFDTIWEIIWRGAMPKLYADPDFPVHSYYAAYLKTYIERDVRTLINVGDEKKFLSFVRGAAARTGQILNIAKLAEDTDVSRSTAERWLSILVSANVVFLLRPFHVNINKREIKAPKLYFLETGLASYLIGWDTPLVLRNGAMGGAFFETFVIAEIIKSYLNKGIQPPLYYYRDKEQREIDLLILRNGLLHPLEIKMTANPAKKHITAFSVLDKLPAPYERGEGALVCLYDEIFSLTDTDRVIPVGYL
ncbi:ATPase [Spirochaetia bacterium]|nr:ATPase [Spirochaetia bacterium]